MTTLKCKSKRSSIQPILSDGYTLFQERDKGCHPGDGKFEQDKVVLYKVSCLCRVRCDGSVSRGNSNSYQNMEFA